jgi:hypothetical protein
MMKGDDIILFRWGGIDRRISDKGILNALFKVLPCLRGFVVYRLASHVT